MLTEFSEFIFRGNLVDLAVAVVIAAAVFLLVVKPVNAWQASRRTDRPSTSRRAGAPSA